MFGHNDENQQQVQDQNGAQTPPAANDQPAVGFPAFTPPATPTGAEPSAPAPSVTTPTETPSPATQSADEIQLPGSDSGLSDLTVPAPTEDASAAPAPATAGPPAPEPAADGGGLTASPNDLIRIKQEALQQLSPLVDHLEQTPEERFRTTMMMIQATDDSSMINEAYEAAQQITDEKVKAQALLDIVNEVNYFSQQQNSQEELN